ncbi:S-layer homology domain-containing protein [Paenibacillus sp. FSL P4-0338]|uniref:S-layer homology domain-containing protein n=1 Tax=Paenibacillus sp. FSL P4-0338 TaxID=2921635 RepID=UPI0030FC4CDA
MNVARKLLSGVLVFATTAGLVLGSTQFTPKVVAASAVSFSDIGDHWAKDSINKAAELGLVTGYTDGTYKPGANVTRAEFAAMLARATKHVPSNVNGAFNDVTPTNWAYADVNKVTALGFVNRVDYPNGFVGSKAMTRIELAKWMANGLAAEDGEYNKAQADSKGPNALIPVAEFFSGGLQKSDYPFVTVAVGTGLMTGDQNGKFNMTANTTRAEVAIILLRYIDVENKKATDFTGLNELREVALTGTNFNTFGKLKVMSPVESQYKNVQDVFGKELTLRNDVATVTISKMIFMDVIPSDSVHSVYEPMFHYGPDESSIGFYTPKYRVFTEHTFVSKVDDLKRLGSLANQGLTTQLGRRLFDSSNFTKYGANSYTGEDTRNVYNKGQGEVNIWGAGVISKTDIIDTMIHTKDGKMLFIRPIL